LLPVTPVLGLPVVSPAPRPPDVPDDLLVYDCSPLLKPPLSDAALPLPVPPDRPLVALPAPLLGPTDLFVAAVPPPVPDDLPLVA
jgi:hypothetical protein